MAVDVKVPGVGESVQEGMISSWHKASGDWVELDDVLLELETDKASVEIPSEVAGVLEILVEEGEVVKVGDTIAKIDTDAKAPEGSGKESSEPKASPDSADDSGQTPESNDSSKAEVESPAVKKLLADNGLNVKDVAGTGKGGLVLKGDVLAHLERSDSTKAPAKKSNGKGASSAPASKQPASGREDQKKPMSMMRRRIAERLVSAQQTAAILTTFNEVDMTEILSLRKKYKEKFQEVHGIKLGFMGFFVKASVMALKEFPAVNAYVDGTDVIYHNYSDIGVAVSTPKGLLVPNIRDAQLMSVREIEAAIAENAKLARDNNLPMDALQGGTFTISNGGVFGSLLSTPILNPPQSAILGMHKTQMRPMVLPDGTIAARPMMYLALSYDHRIVDGKEAVSFLVRIKESLEDPARMLLEM